MRIKRTEVKVYPFAELSDEVQETIIERFRDSAIDYEWWENTFEDAENVGIIIEEFDIDRASFCRGTIDDAIDTARAILKGHGDTCETWQTAKNFHDAVAKDGEDTEDYENLCLDFKYSLLEDYRIILQKEYEYLLSDTVIRDTIDANEYEFTVNGVLA